MTAGGDNDVGGAPPSRLLVELVEVADELENAAIGLAERAHTIEGQPSDPPILSALLLYRGLSHFRAVCVLADKGLGIEARTIMRNIIEVALCIAHVHADADGFVRALESDGAASTIGQAKVLLNDSRLAASLKPEGRRALNEFLGRASEQRQQTLNLGQIARGGEIASLYLAYRVASFDAAHVSALSLARHFVRDTEGRFTHFQLGADNDADICNTLNLAIRAFAAVCVAHNNIVNDREGHGDMIALTERMARMPAYTLDSEPSASS